MAPIPKEPLRFGLYVTKPYKNWAIIAFIFVFFALGVNRISILVIKNLTDAITQPTTHINEIWFWGLSWPALYLIGECFWRLSGFSGMRWVMRSQSYAYEKLYEYLSLHSKDYFSNRFAGSLTNKISNAIGGFDFIFTKMLWQFFPLVVGIMMYIVLTAASNMYLAAIIGSWSVLFVVFNSCAFFYFVTYLIC